MILIETIVGNVSDNAWKTRLTGATLQRRGYGGSARSTDPNHQAREAD